IFGNEEARRQAIRTLRNALSQNQGHNRHWLKVRLLHKSTVASPDTLRLGPPRLAVGVKVRVDVVRADGTTRSIHRIFGKNSSYDRVSGLERIDLSDAKVVARLMITWPIDTPKGSTTQVFNDLAIDQAIEVTEGPYMYEILRKLTLLSPGR